MIRAKTITRTRSRTGTTETATALGAIAIRVRLAIRCKPQARQLRLMRRFPQHQTLPGQPLLPVRHNLHLKKMKARTGCW